MKKCNQCGKEYEDNYDYCPDDGTRLRLPRPPGQGYGSQRIISKEEKAFWEKMTFRQLATVILRMQTVWLFLDAAYNLTYFANSLQRNARFAGFSVTTAAMGFDLFLAAVRVIIPVAMAIFLVTQSETILSWFVKDMVEPDAGENNVAEPPAPPSAGQAK